MGGFKNDLRYGKGTQYNKDGEIERQDWFEDKPRMKK